MNLAFRGIAKRLCVVLTLTVLMLYSTSSLHAYHVQGGSTKLAGVQLRATLAAPVVSISPTKTALGYDIVAADGGIFTFGDAQFYGSTGAIALNRPIVGMASTPDGKGYWLVAADGGIFTFGDAQFYGSTGAIALNRPIVGMASTPDGKGYWLVAADGGIFTFGDAQFYGSTGAIALNRPIVGMASTPDGKGYWLVAADGGIFTFGDAQFYGSTGAIALNRPIVGMASTPDGKGYWLVAADGGIFTFGDAQFYGSTGSINLARPIVGMASTPDGKGYWLVAADGGIFTFGDATYLGSVPVILNTSTAHPILPPSNPSTNAVPNPKFASSCKASSYISCNSLALAAVDNARMALEGLPAMNLPSNFATLTPAEQIFVLIDIERVDRGLDPVIGLVNELNSDAQIGANGFTDPTYGGEAIPGITGSYGWVSMWSDDYSSAASIFDWMYNDGYNSFNYDCQTPTSPSCWGHRDNILASAPAGTSWIMGSYSIPASGLYSQAALMLSVSGTVSPSDFTYTWAEAQSMGAS